MLFRSECGQIAEFYISAQSAGGDIIMAPPLAPVQAWHAPVGEFATLLDDNFEFDTGWTVQNENLVNGAWVRAIPSGNGIVGDPTADYDGSGACFLTGNGNFQDVNGGPTRLLSPAIDLGGTTDPILSYARWFQDSAGGDTLVVELSSDDGQSWVLVESVLATPGWNHVTFTVRDFITPTSAVRLRFSTQDLPNNSFTEAAVDAVRITDFSCHTGCLPGDVNADGLTNGHDIDRFIALVLGQAPTDQELCAADLADPPDGVITTEDIDTFVQCTLSGCGG